MTQEHPITPPPKLVQQWWDGTTSSFYEFQAFATRAARWGADQELEACLEEIIDGAGRVYIDESKLRVCLADDIWTARRPKPPSLKEQALKELAWVDKNLNMPLLNQCDAIHIIRRALESLPD